MSPDTPPKTIMQVLARAWGAPTAAGKRAIVDAILRAYPDVINRHAAVVVGVSDYLIGNVRECRQELTTQLKLDLRPRRIVLAPDEMATLSRVAYGPSGPSVPDDIKKLTAAGEKIAAIKLHRSIHGSTLIEAKDAVEAMMITA